MRRAFHRVAPARTFHRAPQAVVLIALVAIAWSAGLGQSRLLAQQDPAGAAELPQELQDIIDGNFDEATKEQLERFASIVQLQLRIRDDEPRLMNLRLGQIYAKLEQYTPAIKPLTNAINDYEQYLKSIEKLSIPESLATSEEGPSKARLRIDTILALAEAHDARGMANLEIRQPAAAQQDLASAVSLIRAIRSNPDDPDHIKYMVNLSRALLALRAGQAAVDILTQVIALDETHADAHDLRGQAHGIQAQVNPAELQLAIADMAKAIELNPNDKTYYYNLGVVLFQNERYQESVGAFAAAIARYQQEATEDPEIEPYIEPWYARSRALIKVGDTLPQGETRLAAYQASVADANRMLAYNPRQIEAFFLRGLAYRMMEDYDQAIESFSAALELSPDENEVLFRRGIVWYYMGEDDLALRDFQKANVIAGSRDARALTWQGFVHAKRGDYYDAITAYGRAIEQNAAFLTAYINRGLAYLQVGQSDKAISDFNEVIRIEPQRADAYVKRGIAYELAGSDTSAVTSYRTALRIQPNDSLALRKLADAYERLGQNELAREYGERAKEVEDELRKGAEEKAAQQDPAAPPLPDAAEPPGEWPRPSELDAPSDTPLPLPGAEPPTLDLPGAVEGAEESPDAADPGIDPLDVPLFDDPTEIPPGNEESLPELP